MNVKLLIDAIVQQTTVLIAQLSTAAGVRAPLAHVADQVFVELSRELEGQGLGRKVVADMFGMALRGNQKRVQRLTESVTVRDRSLWEVVLEYVREREHVTRREVLARFSRDSEAAVAAVLHDLVTSGLLYASGQGQATLFRATPESALQALAGEGALDSLSAMAVAMVYHQDGLGVASASAADLLVCGVRREAPGVADGCREHAVGLPELALSAPEAAEAEHSLFEASRKRRLERVAVDEMRRCGGDRVRTAWQGLLRRRQSCGSGHEILAWLMNVGSPRRACDPLVREAFGRHAV